MVGSSQKSVVRQLKQMGLCLQPKRHQRRGGPDLCWQTLPRPRRSHRKGAVAKSYPTSRRHQQRSRVGRAKMTKGKGGKGRGREGREREGRAPPGSCLHPLT